MDRNAVVKVCFGGSHLDSNRKTLQHFVCSTADYVQAQHFFSAFCTDQLHQSAWFASRDRVVQIDKVGGVDDYAILSKLFFRFNLSQANGSDRRVTKDDRWDTGVVQLRFWLTVEQPFSQLPTSGNGNWSQVKLPCDISNGKNLWICGRFEFIYQDVTGGCELHTSGLQAQFGGSRNPSNSANHTVEAAETSTVFQMQGL
mmetsp:Transcript_38149/g.75047  ORF Transcript_38149/g.75047 Transcript_38149/m.75047 type:complete len:200 (+) Transcript_38149:120-719(+)